jgi:hypothetical protein
MPAGLELLRRAYALAEAGKLDAAAKLLEKIVHDHPELIEAWEFYLQICTSTQQLHRIACQVSLSKQIDSNYKQEILAYYRFLIRERRNKSLALVRNKSIHLIPYFIPIGLAVLLSALWLRKFNLDNNYFGILKILGYFIAIFLIIYFIRIARQNLRSSRNRGERQFEETIDHVKLVRGPNRPQKK